MLVIRNHASFHNCVAHKYKIARGTIFDLNSWAPLMSLNAQQIKQSRTAYDTLTHTHTHSRPHSQTHKESLRIVAWLAHCVESVYSH